MKKIVLLVTFVLLVLAAPALHAGGFKSYELDLGIGMGASPEKSVFNVPSGDYEITPDFLLFAKVIYNYNEFMAFGIHGYGLQDTIEDVPVVFEGDTFSTDVDYHFSVNYYGAHLRMTFWRDFIRPYVCFGASFASVSLREDRSGELTGGGFVMMGAAGIEVPVTENFAAGLEGAIHSGTVSWAREVFSNSESKEVDVSFYGIMLYISWQDNFSG